MEAPLQRIRIEYSPATCVGNQVCVKSDPFTYHFDNAQQKAILLNGKPQGAIMVAEKFGGPKELQNAIDAAAACPVNAFRVLDAVSGKVLVDNQIQSHGAETKVAQYDDNKDFKLDPQGYFLIRVNYEQKTLEAGFCNSKNVVVLTVTGKKPIEVYHTIANDPSLNLRKEHYAYLGRELEKAYHALMTNLEYVQDDELHTFKPRN